MASGLELLRTRERLRVGERFLKLRPKLATLGALGNAAFLAPSAAAPSQKLALLLTFALTISAFWLEARLLTRYALSERWLFWSLATTLAALSLGALLSGGISSPVLPLLFAPVVVGFAAFARGSTSNALWLAACAALLCLYALPALPGFPALPGPALRGMLIVSSGTSFALLAVGVTGLVEAHASIAATLERARADMLAEAERRDGSVEKLGAQVAHEVKNPLAAARGLVQLVARGVTDDRDKQRLQVVVTVVDRAIAVLEDYLSFAKPLGELSLGSCDARELLDDVAGVLEAKARDKSLTIDVGGEHLELWGDRRRLRDAVLNLALNAVTALPRGGSLRLTVVRRGSNITLEVSDDGPGISTELLPRLGQPFASASDGGTGLGVMLAQSVARQHGGALRFESTPGHGTHCFLELPLTTSEAS